MSICSQFETKKIGNNICDIQKKQHYRLHFRAVFRHVGYKHIFFQTVDHVGVNVKMNYLQPTVCKKWFNFIYSMTLTFDLERYPHILSHD